MEEYISKFSLKYLLNLLFSYYQEYGFEKLDPQCLHNDLNEIIDNMICYKKEQVTGGAK